MRTGALHKLRALQVKRVGDGMHSDGGGLFLKVRGGSRSWVFRFTKDGKKREKGLGSVGAVSLAQAREKAAQAREAVAQGLDPIEVTVAPVRAPAGVPTFKEAAESYIKRKQSEWTSPKQPGIWRNSLRDHAAPLMDLPVDQIEPSDVVATLDPIWTAKPVLASRVRQRIERILSACIVLKQRSAPNPAMWRDGLEHVMSKQRHEVRHHAALSAKEAPEAFARLWDKRDTGQGARGALLVAMTALRSGEIRRLEWSDINVEAGMISIPAARMKARRPHRVPIAPPVAMFLSELPRFTKSDLVLPSTRLGVVSDMTLAAAHKRAGIDATVHGWRSTFSGWANGAGFRRDLVEDALAHQIGSKVERAYRRVDFAEQRREMMEQWAAFLLSKVASNS